VTLEVLDDRVQPLSIKAIDARALPPQEIPPGASGGWIELRDARERTMYSRPVDHPVTNPPELHDPKGPERHQRREVETLDRGVTGILVPDLPDAKYLVFFGPPRTPDGSRDLSSPSVEVARVVLHGD
jgi:hypothetical protein